MKPLRPFSNLNRKLGTSPAAIVPLALYMILIYRLSCKPAPRVAHALPDWLLHSLCYFVFFFLAQLAFQGVFYGYARFPIKMLAFSFTILYGISDEWHQSFVPPRNASVADILYDIGGAAAGAGVYSLYTFANRNKEN